MASTSRLMDKQPDYFGVICIGAGPAGMCLAIQLKRKLGFEDVHIYDRQDDFGGTWNANTYPGAPVSHWAILVF